MMKKTLTLTFWIVSILTATLFGRGTQSEPALYKLETTDNGISTTIPSSLGSVYTQNFNRYTKVTTPNGGSIHIVAQSNLTDGQIIRCRSILEHYLTNYPGSQYGADKSAVANKMAENNAILCLLNGQDDGSNAVGQQVTGQPLYQNEIQVEGHSWYMQQNYGHRDAAFEEILHFVHDNGIGVDGPNTLPGAAPEFQAEIRAAQQNALANNLWGIGASDWIQELTQENSLSQEYLASVVDSYYGLWGAWTESSTHGMWGMYVGKTREDMQTDDPKGYALMTNKFFHPYLTYNAQIDASLNGNFSLKFDASKPYTHHSRYLKDVTLLGSNDNTVTVNELDNNITGNSGTNTVIFSGKSTEYTITQNNGVVTVKDNISGRDGVNTLSNIEKLQFTDTVILTNAISLNIELLGFNARNINNEYVKLDWYTATESENDYFEIERSKSGIDWEVIVEVDGAGDSDNVIKYEAQDKEPYDGVSYYRLKQTDVDGAYSYSDVVTVSIAENKKFIVYPNPASELITVETGKNTKYKQIKVLNAAGQVVTTRAAKYGTTKIDVSTLMSGVYFVKVGTEVRKVIVD